MADDKANVTDKPAPVLRWLGDEGRFHTGIPNRDITEADGLTDEQIELAVASGTHTKD